MLRNHSASRARSLLLVLLAAGTASVACGNDSDPDPGGPAAPGGSTPGGSGGAKGDAGDDDRHGGTGGGAAKGGDSPKGGTVGAGGSMAHSGSSSGGAAARGGSSSGAAPATGGSTHGGAGPSGGRIGVGGLPGAGLGGDDTSGAAGEAGERGAGASGAAGAGGEAGGPEDPREFLYVTRLLGGVLSLELDMSSGVPRELPSAPAIPERFLYAVVADPAERFLFTAEPEPGGHVDSYRIRADGTIAETPDSVLELVEGPIALAVDPVGQFLYVGTFDDHALRAFAIDSTTGALTPAGEPVVLDTTPTYIAIDPSGRFLYGSHGLIAGIHGFHIGQGGALEALAGSPFGATTVRAGAMVFSPDGTRVYASGLALHGFTLDPTSGALDPLEGSPFSTDIGSDAFARNIAIDPEGKYLYTTAFTATRHISGYAIDPESGGLDPVPGLPLQTPAPYSVAVDPSGLFVIVGNDSEQLSVFSIDRGNGSLDELDASPFPLGGLQPQFAFARR